MSSGPARREPFPAVQRIRYTVWCAGLAVLLLITSTQAWVCDHAVLLSLWELPQHDGRDVSGHGMSALGMLLLALALTLLAAWWPARPVVLCALLAAVLSFLNTMWLHQALTGTPTRLPGFPASITAGPGVAAALAETLALMLGLGLLALVDSAPDVQAAPGRPVAGSASRTAAAAVRPPDGCPARHRALVPQPADRAAQPAGLGPQPAGLPRRLRYAAQGSVLAVLLLLAETLPWAARHLRHPDGTETTGHLSLWELAAGSAGDRLVPAAELALTLLVVSCLLMLLIAAEPDRFVAAWVLLSLVLTLPAAVRLHLALSASPMGDEGATLTALPGEAVALAVLIAAMVAVAALLLPRGRRTFRRRRTAPASGEPGAHRAP
ncbi:hypothetical protein Sru01_37610 [Sphaerisporangium rufum]|uniref:Uncharacterized protein n=1 Tax=Sphaerisporangium rufum TaxID=1381558 RepID=A0A919V0H8_9ACTN|nr:hypothetical protein [Sphaerisporangium rufum]GII78779.1 hypothetical protein Sru01_37610 [Sphaerisporangium rufum]